MKIIIEEINTNNAKDVNMCDGEFIIDSKLALYVEDDEIRTQLIKIPDTKKRYGYDDIHYSTYVDDPSKIVFFANVDGHTAGQIILRKNWNNYAYVEDITVDTNFRRQGVGKELILQAEQWAQKHNLAGIMLETQNNNVVACHFYESCGFKLGGFDKYLYTGINKETDEVALYWYMLFEDTLPNTV